MAEDEVEKFEITDFDLENEFTSHRRGKRLTKEEQIYGVWAQKSDGEVCDFFYIYPKSGI